MEDRKRITLADVAAAAGVSKMTASRALRGARDVSRANIAKVEEAAKSIGYVGNHLAASLSGQRSDLVGVVVPSISNVVFAEVLAGIADGIDGSGLQPVFGVTDYDTDKEYDVLRKMLSWNPSGLIVTGLDQPDDTRRLLARADVPVVQIMDSDGDPVDACIGFSNRDAGAAMAEALMAKGRRHFGYIGIGLDQDSRAEKRRAGFEAALRDAGLEFEHSEIRPGASGIMAGRQMTARALAAEPELDCLYFSNDDLAAGGAYHCIAASISVPDQVTLAGFNGLDLIEGLPVQIATSHTHRRDIGRRAADVVLAGREKKQARPVRLDLPPYLSLDG